MKKKLLTIIIIFFIFFPMAFAKEIETAIVNAPAGLRLRVTPTTDASIILSMPHGSKVQVLEKGFTGTGCDAGWMKVVYNSKEGYTCSAYLINFKNETIPDDPVPPVNPIYNTDEEFYAYLRAEGFPESYFAKLNELRKKHPNWTFKAIKSRDTWTNLLNYQDFSGRALLGVYLNSTYEGWLSTRQGDYNWETNIFKPYDGLVWKQASREVIAYHIDPRNYLDERTIFMFETLSYNRDIHTTEVVRNVLYSDFLRQFTSLFMKAAEVTNASPLFLAAVSRQEVGTSSTNIVTNGKAGVLSDGVDYTGYYNFFNVGASSSSDPKLKSLQSAKARGWNTQEKSITGGAQVIAGNYIKYGQDTLFYQKFNHAGYSLTYMWNQYQTNISAPSSTAVTTFNSYNNMGIINSSFVFHIPVYEGMPEVTTLPPLGNPNNWLKNLKVNGVTLTGFSGSITDYKLTVSGDVIKIEGTPVYGKAQITGLGTFDLSESKTFEVVVKAENGSLRKYKVEVTKTELPETDVTINQVLTNSIYKIKDNKIHNIALGTNVAKFRDNIIKDNIGISINIKDSSGVAKLEGTIVNGDIVTISTKNETIVFYVIIYGDVTGTGQIGIVDLGSIQKHLLSVKKLEGNDFIAADVNRDGKITIVDLGMLQKHLLKISYINQS